MVETVEFFKDHAVFHINPELYSLEAVLNAAYVLSEHAYIIIDGDIDRDLFAIIKPKGNANAKELALNFGNELVSAQVYIMESARQTKITETIINEALNGIEGQEDEQEH